MARTVRGVRPIEGNFCGPETTSDGVRSVTVVIIQAFPCFAIVGIVVVSLICSHALLVEQRRYAGVIAHDEDNVVLVALCVGEQCKIDAAGPRCGHSQHVGGRPVTDEQARVAIAGGGRLLDAIERANALEKAAT